MNSKTWVEKIHRHQNNLVTTMGQWLFQLWDYFAKGTSIGKYYSQWEVLKGHQGQDQGHWRPLLHNKWDQRLYIPSEGRSIMVYSVLRLTIEPTLCPKHQSLNPVLFTGRTRHAINLISFTYPQRRTLLLYTSSIVPGRDHRLRGSAS